MKTILMMAQTLDGKIARSPNHFPDWTGKADKRLFVEVTRRAGVIIMGSSTFDTLKTPLPGRRLIVMTRDPSRRTNWDNAAFTREAPPAILKRLEAEGYDEVVLAGGATINGLFAAENLIDELMITVVPIVFGKGISMFDREVSMKLDLIEFKPLGEGLVWFHYRVARPPDSTVPNLRRVR
ncbi:MAG: dihydrofolate reductase family protein [Desulfobacterales bacterium]